MSAHTATSHDDLMDLACRFSYRTSLAEGYDITVNGKAFVVLSVRSDPVTGLDAMTVQNTRTDEISVVFQGTVDGTDVIADLLLVTTQTPAQYAAALTYFAEMQQRFGPVGSVSGNSLGGGLAAYVAVRNPGTRAVTVNPAPVPHEMAGLPAPNVRNYVTATDPLYRAIVVGGLQDRLLGEKFFISGSSFHLDFLLANHVGSDLNAPDRPYDASMAVPFSLFHQDQVVGADGLGELVDVSVENLVRMAAGLRHQQYELVTVLASELDDTEQELRRHNRDLATRADRMCRTLAEALVEEFQTIRRELAEVLADIDARLRSPVAALPVAPLPLTAVWRGVTPGVLDAVRQAASGACDVAAFGVAEAARTAWRLAWEVLGEESEVITSALVDESVRLRGSAALVNRKWSAFASFADIVAGAVADADATTAAAIASRRCPRHPVRVKAQPWPTGAVQELEDNRLKQFHQTVADIRQTVVGEVVITLADELAEALRPLSDLCKAVVAALELAETQLGVGAAAVQVAVDAYSRTGTGFALEHTTGGALQRFATEVRDQYTSFKASSDAVQEDLWRVARAVDALPLLVQVLRPYLDETFFSDTVIESAYDSFLQCRNLVERSELAFAEVHHQLADHDARMITALAERADDLSTDLRTTASGLRAMVS